MKSLTQTYDHHVDARYFNFIWTEAMYINVEYIAVKENGQVNATVQKISAPPYLISAIVMHGGWQVLMAEIDQSAKDHAEKELKGGVHPVFEQALKPFI